MGQACGFLALPYLLADRAGGARHYSDTTYDKERTDSRLLELFLWEYGNVKTTLEIPNPLFKRVKARAAMGGLKLKDVAASALSAYLTRPRSPSQREGRPCPFPLVRGKVRSLMKQMNNETIAALQEFDALIAEGINSEHFPLTDSVWEGIRQRGRKLAQKLRKG